MVSRLPVRALLAAAVALIAGFAGAFIVLDLADELAPAELLVQIGAAYVTWVVLALAAYLLIRRFVPGARDRVRGADAPPAPPREGREASESTPDDIPSPHRSDSP